MLGAGSTPSSAARQESTSLDGSTGMGVYPSRTLESTVSLRKCCVCSRSGGCLVSTEIWDLYLFGPVVERGYEHVTAAHWCCQLGGWQDQCGWQPLWTMCPVSRQSCAPWPIFTHLTLSTIPDSLCPFFFPVVYLLLVDLSIIILLSNLLIQLIFNGFTYCKYLSVWGTAF